MGVRTEGSRSRGSREEMLRMYSSVESGVVENVNVYFFKG